MCRRQDELGILARDFNQMAERLRSQIASKEMLLRDISHELRSPLTRLRVALGLAQRGDGNLDVQLSRIERDVERLDALIGQTLQLSRLSGAEPTLTRQEVELGNLVNEVVEDAHFEASAMGKQIAPATMSGVMALGNFELLRRAVDNVIRNAIRFTPVGSKVEVSTRIDTSGAVLAVRDQAREFPSAISTASSRRFIASTRQGTARAAAAGWPCNHRTDHDVARRQCKGPECK